MEFSRTIPRPVARALRQEASFGCCDCGCPILEYHHIIPWEERRHYDVDHMIALCPTCHSKYQKLPRQRCYDLKKEPVNRSLNKLSGELDTTSQTSSFLVGSTTYINTPIIFSYFGQSVIEYRIENGAALVGVYIPRKNYWPDILMRDNQMIINCEGKWDIEFKTNYLNVQKKNRESYFRLRLVGDVAEVETKFSIGKNSFEFSPTSTNIGGGTITNSESVNCGAGIVIGNDAEKLFWPNYAMSRPQPIIWKS